MSDPVHPHHHDAPDRFTRWGEDAASILEAHWRRILGGVVVVLLLGAVWVWHAHSRNRTISDGLTKVAEIAAQFPGDGGEVPEPAIRTALERYETFLKGAPKGSSAYWIARFHVAEAHDALGETDAARTAFEALLQAPPVYRGPARMRLAYLALAGGDLKVAGAAFAKVAEENPGLAPQAVLEQGRLAEFAGDKDAAIAAYKQVTAKYTASLQAAEADTRLRALGVEPELAPTPEFAGTAPEGGEQTADVPAEGAPEPAPAPAEEAPEAPPAPDQAAP